MLPTQSAIKNRLIYKLRLSNFIKNVFLSNNIFPGATLFIVFLVNIPKLFKGLNDLHGFRQTQTAFGVKYFSRNSLNPFNATLPISGPESRIPLEFPIFQLIASFPARIIGNHDFSARLTGLLSFMICVYLLFRLSVNIFNEHIAKISTIIFSFSPLSLQWASSSLIEFTAVAFSLAAMLSFINYLNTSKMRYFGFFVVFISVGMIVKITTAVGWILASLILIYLYSKKIRIRSYFYVFCSLVFSLTIFISWITWSDNVKSSEEWWAPSLTSQGLRNWNFGTIEMRMDLLKIYDAMEKISQPIVGGVGIFVIIVIYSFSRIKSNPFLSPFLAVVLSSPIIFFPLFSHSYYATSISPAIALLCGNLINDLTSKINTKFIFALSIILVSFSTNLGLVYAREYFNYPKPPQISDELKTSTPIDADIMLRCNDDWSSEYLYYADREGLMLRYKDIIPGESEWGTKYTYLAFCNEGNIDLSIVPDSVYLEVESKLLYKIHRK